MAVLHCLRHVQIPHENYTSASKKDELGNALVQKFSHIQITQMNWMDEKHLCEWTTVEENFALFANPHSQLRVFLNFADMDVIPARGAFKCLLNFWNAPIRRQF